MSLHLHRQAPSADIALLLEGTFPYVDGGVSAWVNQLLHTFPEISFAIVFIGGQRKDYGSPRFELPDNVVHFEEYFIHEQAQPEPASHERLVGNKAAFKRSEQMHDMFRKGKDLTSIGKVIRDTLPLLHQDKNTIDEKQFLYSQCAWSHITQSYEKYCTDPSFTDYFWTVRIMHKPLWQLTEIANNLPPVRLYHTISTGYAGFLGALLHFRNGKPLLVSEHGIYTKERKIDLLQSQWIRDNRDMLERDVSQVGYFQALWVRFFGSLGRICYEAAEDIVALYEGNRQRQIKDGAAAEKTNCIPNGIDIARFAGLRDQRPVEIPLVAVLIGRVVPIKDIKTFIRAIYIARSQMPGLQGWVVGPEAEDPDYVSECHELARSLGLHEGLQFLGFKKINEVLPHAGLVVLSSISEALPLVVLEAFAAGVPVVTTDVGACRELIEGNNDADYALGAAGEVVQIASPDKLAQAIARLLQNPTAWRAAQQAGIQRVERYYSLHLMEDSYRKLYQKLLAFQSY